MAYELITSSELTTKWVLIAYRQEDGKEVSKIAIHGSSFHNCWKDVVKDIILHALNRGVTKEDLLVLFTELFHSPSDES